MTKSPAAYIQMAGGNKRTQPTVCGRQLGEDNSVGVLPKLKDIIQRCRGADMHSRLIAGRCTAVPLAELRNHGKQKSNEDARD